MSFQMIGSRQPIAELQGVEEEGRRFHARVPIAKRNSVRATCVSISRTATKLRNASIFDRRKKDQQEYHRTDFDVKAIEKASGPRQANGYARQDQESGFDSAVKPWLPASK
jgi:hypothetical protein